MRRFIETGRKFYTFEEFLQAKDVNLPMIIVRHDVDRRPGNSLMMAQLEHSLGIRGSYYFRIVPESFHVPVIRKIAELGHEIGYHYEDIDLALKAMKREGKDVSKISEAELIDAGFTFFQKNLATVRSVAPVQTICMHGSPLSAYDNKLLWRKYSYKELGLIGEPYYDTDFNQFAYFTDTGRRWNGDKMSVRDKVQSKYSYNFKHTHGFLKEITGMPERIMLTIHPERWSNHPVKWAKELVMQNIKNQVKKIIVARNK
ncbi:MAG: hypothetical protein LWX56_10715 [Ignavibacteria bacterium]|nr:hypothetical protein [Ignavibacteria bacterium]